MSRPGVEDRMLDMGSMELSLNVSKSDLDPIMGFKLTLKGHACSICKTKLAEPHAVDSAIYASTVVGSWSWNVADPSRISTMSKIRKRDAEKDHDTYSPVTQEALESHLDNIILIGSKKSVYVGEEEDEDSVLIDADEIVALWLKRDFLEGSMSDCRFGWRASEPLPAGDSLIDISSLYSPPNDDFERLPDCNEDAVIVHRQCWELFQSITVRGGGVEMSPGSFFHRMKTLIKEESWSVGTGERNFQMLEKMAAASVTGREQGAESISEEAKVFRRAYHESYRSGIIDYHARDVLWKSINAHIYHSPSDFPIQEAFKREAKRNIELDKVGLEHRQGLCDSTFAKLPVEVIHKIALSTCNVDSALQLASTCTSLRLAIVPLLDDVALEEIRSDHPYLLAMTPHDERQWQAYEDVSGASSEDDIEKGFPWRAYLHECLRPNAWAMINRKSICSLVTELLAKMRQTQSYTLPR